MPGLEQNKGSNLKLKSASHLETERSEILNSGSTQHVKTLRHFLWLLVTDVTPLLASHLTELGHKLKNEKCMLFE